MNRIKVGIDLDTTLNKLEDKWLAYYNKDYNDNLTTKDIKSWDIHSYTKQECQNKMYDYLLYPGFFRDLEVQPNSQEVTKWMSEYFDLYIVTAYHWETCKDKAEWVIENYPHINSKNIIFCNYKSLVGLDYLIDDGLHNLEGFKGIGLLFDAWHNQNDDRFNRIFGWLDIKKYFEELIVMLHL